MKANELRLNNYYQLKGGVLGGGFCRITTIKDFKEIYELIYSNSVEPIPLTEEWLIKFGFKKQEDGFLYIKLKRMGTRLEINMKKKLICLIHNGMPMDVVHLPYIKYVHQLQNLYFALTGVELELSSNVA